MHVQRRLFRALLRQIHQFKHDGLPLLGLAGAAGQALLRTWNPFPAYDVSGILKFLFRQEAAAPDLQSTDAAITALRILASQRRTLSGSEEHTRQACRAWQQLLHSQHASFASSNLSHPYGTDHQGQGAGASEHSNPTYSQHPSLPDGSTGQQPVLAAQQTAHDAQEHVQASSNAGRTTRHPHQGTMTVSSWPLPGSLEHTAALVQQLHVEMQPGWLGEDSWQDVNDSNEQRFQVVEALSKQGFPAALHVMARHIQKQHPSLFSCPQSLQTPDGSTDTGVLNEQLQAVQQYVYKVLKLRHEPIEWVYDGLGPLLPGAALQLQKAAPFTLAMLITMVCGRLGVNAMPMRASPAVQHVPPGQDALFAGTLMPQDVAVRQAQRTASYLPTDAWIVAAVAPAQPPTSVLPSEAGQRKAASSSYTVRNGQEGGQEGRGRSGQAAAQKGRQWMRDGCRLLGIYLDVSCGGGAVLTRQQLQARHPHALEQFEQDGMFIQPERVYLQLCAEWARAMMVAHQRRGESDLVSHWLVQVLALDPSAPEWDALMEL